jgi:metal-responsive CopG/Arc/MetJ family transcriptional regulator
MEKRIKDIKINLWVDSDLLERFDNASKKDGRDRSSAIRNAMEDYIKKVGDNNK